jgi:hypothetical protein
VDQPAQENPPRGAQLLPPESEAADPKDATAESFFWVLGLSQAGHPGRRSASEKRIIISNSLPQSEQRYSYKGMGRFLFHPRQDEVVISNKKAFHHAFLFIN